MSNFIRIYVDFLSMIDTRAAVFSTGARLFHRKRFFINFLECNVVLIMLTLQQHRYVMAATSVDIPECPPSNDCVRGRVRKDFCLFEEYECICYCNRKKNSTGKSTKHKLQKQPLADVPQNRCSEKFRNIHRKLPAIY